MGISYEQQYRIFSFWNKVKSKNNPDNMKNRGIGFGLYISSKIAQLLAENYKLELKSEPKKGSTFSFYINF